MTRKEHTSSICFCDTTLHRAMVETVALGAPCSNSHNQSRRNAGGNKELTHSMSSQVIVINDKTGKSDKDSSYADC